MNKWIRVGDELPKAVVGAEGEPANLSDDVAVLFETGIEVAMYDHEVKRWVMVNADFEEPIVDPLYWTPLPDFPEGFRLSL